MNKFKKIIECLKNPGLYKSYFYGVAPMFELMPLLKKISNINTLVDVGSNKGQFGVIARKFFPGIRIHSFEPQEDQLNIQKKVLGDYNIKYYNIALGNDEKTTKIYITKRKDSSSLLKPANTTNEKYLVNATKIINLQKLNNIAILKEIEGPSVLKLDVQGFELETLKGGDQIIDNFDYIIIEVSFVKIYENQVYANELYDFLNAKSFKLEAKCNFTMLDGKSFQEDLLFIKKKD